MHQYIESPDIYQFTAVVQSVLQTQQGYEIVLDQSFFFPEAGGQPSDYGTINDIKVLKVIDKHPIIHIVEQQLQVNQQVQCVIDKKQRIENSRQHTGQHILSAVARRIFNANSESFKICQPLNSIELSQKLSREQLDQIEQDVNQIILQNIPVQTDIITEQQKIPDNLRKQYNYVPLRIVSIDNVDACPCCGTHVNRTGELGVCKIFQQESIKSGTKIYFAFGNSAFYLMQKKLNILSSVCEQFTCGGELALNNVINAKSNIKLLNKKYSELQKNTINLYLQQNAIEVSKEKAFLFVDFLIQQQDANQYIGVLGKKYQQILLAFCEENGLTQLIYIDNSKQADLFLEKVQQKYSEKISKFGGNNQRKSIILSLKLKLNEVKELLE